MGVVWPEDGSSTFLRNVGGYQTTRCYIHKMAIYIVTAVLTTNPALFIAGCKNVAITRNCTLFSLAWVFYLLYMLYSNLSHVLLLVLSCFVCNCCWLTVCIVVVVLCVLLSYVYLLYYVGMPFFFSSFRCQTAG